MELTLDKALQQGIAAHRKGDLKEAELLYRAILRSQPAHPDANHNLGVIAVSVNNSEAALPLFKTALEINPSIEQYWVSYIEALIKEQKFEIAMKILAEGRKKVLVGERADALEAHLRAMSQPGKPEGSEQKKSLTFSERRRKISDKKKTKSPSSKDINSLSVLYQSGRYGDAEKLAISITEKFPRHQFGWKVLGAVFKLTGRISESLIVSQKAVKINPQDADAHNNLGIILQEMGRLEQAEVSLRQALALKKNYAEAYYNLGNVLKGLGRLKEAEASYRKGVSIRPNFPELHNNLGNTLKELGRLEDAETSFRKVVALQPDYAEAQSNLGMAQQELGRLKESEESCRKAIAIKPDFAEAHYNLGVTLQELGRLSEAETSYRQAIAVKPDFADPYCSLGVTLNKLGRLDEAEASYRRAIAVKPAYAAAKHLLAALLGETTNSAPSVYVEKLFDGYAHKFEQSLVDELEYDVPKIITDMIVARSHKGSLGSILDLGCGTGLTGIHIKQFCTNLEGVDLSKAMLEKAREKNVYDKLVRQNIVDYLLAEDLNFDVFISTDVFIYVGDLSDTFRLIQSRNRSGGKFVFSTEHADTGEFTLERSGRYTHSKMYIESLCKKFNYKLCHFENVNLRKENDRVITGGLYLLEF